MVIHFRSVHVNEEVSVCTETYMGWYWERAGEEMGWVLSLFHYVGVYSLTEHPLPC
jgi:hypothetical protein